MSPISFAMFFSAMRLTGFQMRRTAGGIAPTRERCSSRRARPDVPAQAETSSRDSTLRSKSTRTGQSPTMGKLPTSAYGQPMAVQRNAAPSAATADRHRGHTNSGRTRLSVASATCPPSYRSTRRASAWSVPFATVYSPQMRALTTALIARGTCVRPEHRSPFLGRPDRRPRVLVMLVLLAAAMPFRFPVWFPASFPVVRSVSILDLMLMVGLITLVLDLKHRGLNLGYPPLALLLAFPALASALSLVWSEDRIVTLRTTVNFLEAFVAYLFVTRELAGLSAARIVVFLRRYVWLVTLPAVFLLLHVPGFAPYEPGLSPTSGDYLSYYTRLSHPLLGRSNNLAAVLVILVPVLLYFGHTRRDRLTTFTGLVAATAVVCTFSRGAMVASLIAGIVCLLLSHRPFRGRLKPLIGKVVTGTLALAAAPVALYLLNPATHEFFAGRLSAANILLRAELYRAAFEKIVARPLLGYGAGVAPRGDTSLVVDVHNTYVQQVLYYGVLLGLLVGLAVLSLPFFFLRRRGLHPLAGAVGFGVLAEVISFTFESSFEGTVLRVIFYLLLGMLAGLLRSSIPRQRREAPQHAAEVMS
ncbi:O-antigen ligase family protein [Actinopolymorpha rutila]|uniref:O-antigen ligase n=1 Tax=Actinopolymorpha rutila TaxID=446787 RepID=A0A852ZDA7_9ACTN|nr:O-antigen ligase family protein [Actinopolymorpha rutila]NYH90874.1 O-antigen ligase [Actinopolymorpha rutila]